MVPVANRLLSKFSVVKREKPLSAVKSGNFIEIIFSRFPVILMRTLTPTLIGSKQWNIRTTFGLNYDWYSNAGWFPSTIYKISNAHVVRQFRSFNLQDTDRDHNTLVIAPVSNLILPSSPWRMKKCKFFIFLYLHHDLKYLGTQFFPNALLSPHRPIGQWAVIKR